MATSSVPSTWTSNAGPDEASTGTRTEGLQHAIWCWAASCLAFNSQVLEHSRVCDAAVAAVVLGCARGIALIQNKFVFFR